MYALNHFRDHRDIASDLAYAKQHNFWYLPRKVWPWLGNLLSKLPWRYRHIGRGWCWYYAQGQLSALNRDNWSGWYRVTR